MAAGGGGWGGKFGEKKNAISLYFDASETKISVLLSTSVKRFGVSRMRDFLIQTDSKQLLLSLRGAGFSMFLIGRLVCLLLCDLYSMTVYTNIIP